MKMQSNRIIKDFTTQQLITLSDKYLYNPQA